VNIFYFGANKIYYNKINLNQTGGLFGVLPNPSPPVVEKVSSACQTVEAAVGRSIAKAIGSHGNVEHPINNRLFLLSVAAKNLHLLSPIQSIIEAIE
jgi:hypothetical protein